MKKQILLRAIDRWIIGSLAVVLAASGLYLVGPWYLEARPDGNSPLYYLTGNIVTIRAIGAGMLLSATGLLWSVRTKLAYSIILSSSLLAAFLLRLFTLLGTLLTLESWRPPNYISPLFTVVVAGVYWVWVRRHEGSA